MCCGMDHLVDVLVTSEEVGEAKPARAIFAAALERVGCEPGQTVMVGDSWAVDVVGAHGVGIRPIWLNRHARPCPAPGLAVGRQAGGWPSPLLDELLALLLGAVAGHRQQAGRPGACLRLLLQPTRGIISLRQLACVPAGPCR
jgi:hypothetical protein